MTRVTKVCKHCGSENVSHDGLLRWSIETQEWEVCSVFDNSNCDDCGAEDCVEDKEIIE